MTTRVMHHTTYEFPLDSHLYGQTFVIGNHTKFSDLETAVISHQNDTKNEELKRIQENLARNKFNTQLGSSKDYSHEDLIIDWAAKGRLAMAYHYFHPQTMKNLSYLNAIGGNIDFHIHLHCMADLYFKNLKRNELSKKQLKTKDSIDQLMAELNPTFIAVSEGVKRSFVESGLIPGDKIKVVKNGVSSDLYDVVGAETKEEFRKNLGINAEKLVGYVGRLEYVKGAQGLLSILNYYNQNPKNLGFVIASSGGDQFLDFSRQVKKVAPKLIESNKLKFCLDASKLTSNFYTRDQLLETQFYKNIRASFSDLPFVDVITTPLQPNLDVYIQPAVSEGISLSIIEALMSGVPVVASNVGGIPEVVNFNNGTLIDIENRAPTTYRYDFADAINHWISKPLGVGHARKLRQNLIMAGFDAKNMATKLDKIYSGEKHE